MDVACERVILGWVRVCIIGKMLVCIFLYVFFIFRKVVFWCWIVLCSEGSLIGIKNIYFKVDL